MQNYPKILSDVESLINGSADAFGENTIIKTLIYHGVKVLYQFQNLESYHFKVPENAKIFRYFKEMNDNEIEIDLVSLFSYIKEENIKNYVIELNSDNRFYCDLNLALKCASQIIVQNREEATRKALKKASENYTNEKADEVLGYLSDLMKIQNESSNERPSQFMPIVIENISNPKPKINTQFQRLNDLFFGGWNIGAVHTIAGRPGHGKTSMMTSLISYDLKMKRKVGVFSIEMSETQFITKLISNNTKIPHREIYNYKKEVENGNEKVRLGFSKACVELEQKDLLRLFCGSSINAIELYNKIKEWKLNFGAEIIYIDYLDKIEHNFNKGNQKTYAIQDTMKWITRAAKDFQIPIILLAQIDRNSDRKQISTNFVLSELSDSKSVDQDSHSVSFLVRPEKYNEKTIEFAGNEIESEGLAVLVIAKNREGKQGRVIMKFEGDLTLFEPYEIETKYEEAPKSLSNNIEW